MLTRSWRGGCGSVWSERRARRLWSTGRVACWRWNRSRPWSLWSSTCWRWWELLHSFSFNVWYSLVLTSFLHLVSSRWRSSGTTSSAPPSSSWGSWGKDRPSLSDTNTTSTRTESSTGSEPMPSKLFYIFCTISTLKTNWGASVASFYSDVGYGKINMADFWSLVWFIVLCFSFIDF